MVTSGFYACIYWVWPPRSNSDHQEYHVYTRFIGGPSVHPIDDCLHILLLKMAVWLNVGKPGQTICSCSLIHWSHLFLIELNLFAQSFWKRQIMDCCFVLSFFLGCFLGLFFLLFFSWYFSCFFPSFSNQCFAFCIVMVWFLSNFWALTKDSETCRIMPKLTS